MAATHTLDLFRDQFADTHPAVTHPAVTQPAFIQPAFNHPDAAQAEGTDRTAFELGWDYAHYRLAPPADALTAYASLRQGFDAGAQVFGQRTLKATPHVRKWLQLRLSAWRRGKPFEATQVTPNFLAQIDVPTCPITRAALTHGSGAGTDASVDRVNNAAGYAAGNLAVISTRANQAKADNDWRDAMDTVRQLEASGLDTLDGLAPVHWSRLAVLMSFTSALPHAQAACLPLLVLPPNRLRLLNAVQALQTVVTLAFTQGDAVPRLRELMAHLPALARHAFQVFVLTLQARRMAMAKGLEGSDLRQALEDMWADAAVNRRWQRFALQITEADAERAVRIAAKKGLAGKGWQWLPKEAAVEGWVAGEQA